MGRRLGSHPKKPPTSFGRRLTKEQNDDILKRKRKGQTVAEIARAYGVSRNTMGAVVRNLMDIPSYQTEAVRKEGDLKRIMDIPLAKKTIEKVSSQFRVTPQEAAQGWLNVIDQIALAGLQNTQEKYCDKYDGLEELGLGYTVSGDLNDARKDHENDTSWIQKAMAAEDWSAKELTQIMVAQAKMYMELMPYFHPRIGSVEPKQKSQGLEEMTPDKRRARIKELGAKLGFEIKEAG